MYLSKPNVQLIYIKSNPAHSDGTISVPAALQVHVLIFFVQSAKCDLTRVNRNVHGVIREEPCPMHRDEEQRSTRT
jgi:hypothetical protein